MYNSGASASIFQVGHVNYENASQRTAGEARGACGARLPVIQASCPSWEIAAPPRWLAQLTGAWCKHILLWRLVISQKGNQIELHKTETLGFDSC